MNTTAVLVTGATGYVGGRVVLRLIDAGYKVRATGRSLAKLKSRAWAKNAQVELVASDALDMESIKRAADGCWAAYYFVHSMNVSSPDFVETDRKAAENMAEAAKSVGLERIIYLGGLGYEDEFMSAHLRSRQEVGKILASGGIPVTCFRAPMILGSGSASFEMLRYLVDRLPIIITSRRVFTKSQPIAIRNVLVALVKCLEIKETIGETYDMGGPEILQYKDLINIYAEEAGLRKRIVIPTRWMTPRLASYIIHFITPIPRYLAEPLSAGLGNEMLVKDGGRLQKVIPQKMLTARETIRMALERMGQKVIKSSWMDAGAYKPPEWGRYNDAPYAGGAIEESWYDVTLKAPPETVWEPISKIGGDTGWYFANWLWDLRGFIDSLAGGYGRRRGRRHPVDIRTGDALDWWRVIDASPGKRLLLVAEMKAPGEATLEFRIEDMGGGLTKITQIASFLPRGLAGIIYWYAVWPMHFFIFRGMLNGIAKAAGAEVVEGPVEIKPPPHRRV
ncbi:Putative nucleoside-diphosphate-sugar epimerase [hydrothermal vent metagenome]|uniref:Nucleoside-diphosphate-sugar epimerase n=1 Tax=hydrothermal vent metagenome TaxID=652676 RepID=A0A3B1CDH4_9ZZZZ